MRHRPSGFTLIELMVVVAIIGLLSSIAVPSFRNLQLRSKQAERSMMTRTIDVSLEDYYVREGRYPQGTPSDNYFSGTWNPAWPPITQKRPWVVSSGDWSRLAMRVDGNLYYSYYAYAYAYPGYRIRYVYAYGDLDGDRQYNFTYHYVQRYGPSTAPQTYVYDYDSAVWDHAF